MKQALSYSLPYLLLLGFSCQQGEDQVSKKNSSMPVQYVSQAYVPPSFREDQRSLRLKDLAQKIDAFYRQKAEENHLPGLVYGIVVDDSLVISGAYGLVNLENEAKVDAHSLFRIASMTKSFVCMAILKLRDEGKLSLHTPAADYLPVLAQQEYLSRDAVPITVEHLMTMSAGFPEDNPWADRQLEDKEEEFSAFMDEGMSMSNLPGMAYEYSNLGYAMLGRIISEVSGQPYQQYITEQILHPLSMYDTHWEYEKLPAEQLALGYRWEEEQWKKEPMLHDGAFGAIGGIITSLSDFSRYVSYHLSAWPPRSEVEKGPLKRSSLREMHQMKNPRLYADARDAEGDPCAYMAAYAYGLGIYEDCQGHRRVSHSGGLPGFGSEYQFYPDYGIGIISFANRTYAPARSLNAELSAWLLEELNPQKRQLPVSSILARRKEEVAQLVQHWQEDGEDDFIAENFYLDQSRRLRKEAAAQLWDEAGKVLEVGEISPLNQLRGTFILHCEKKDVEVFFSLSPEKVPKVQAVRMRLL